MNEHGGYVAVTGVGVVSPLGVGREAFWGALCRGESGIREGGYARGFPRLTAPMAAYDARTYVASAHLRRMDRLSRTIVTAVRLALADAGLSAGLDIQPGVVVGSALGNISESVQYLHRLFSKGPALASPMMFPNLVLNTPASYTAMEIGSMGANFTVSQGEASGEHALALGCDLIRSGRAEIVLAGGGDEIDDIVIDAYRRFHALAGQRGGAEWCSPYDRDRSGVVLGEGAGILVLESPAHAHARGVTPYAEIEAWQTFGVQSPLFDWPTSAPAAVRRLHELLARVPARYGDAGLAGATVDLVCGSANSSRRLDACELDVFSRLFGETAAAVSVTSIKGAVGEFGAAGALSAAALCLALHEGCVPPLCHLRHPPPDVLLRLASPVARAEQLRRGLLFALARGGAATAFLLRRPV